MTVCIAAIAEARTEYPKIIFAADREVTSWISYTSGVSKIRRLTQSTCVMTATNNALISNDLVTKAKKQIEDQLREEPEAAVTVEDVVEAIAYQCKSRLYLAREKFVLYPYGLSYDSFTTKANDLPEEYVERIMNDLKEFGDKFQAEFLVVGIDFEPHIFVIDQSGEYISCDVEGFAVIGSGKYTAFPEITKYPYSPDLDWLSALHRVYNSKKGAERVGGVGTATDLVVLHKTKDEQVSIWDADDNTIHLLESGRQKVLEQEAAIYWDLLRKFHDILSSSSDTTNSGDEL